jgi:hypothetical protein
MVEEVEDGDVGVEAEVEDELVEMRTLQNHQGRGP